MQTIQVNSSTNIRNFRTNAMPREKHNFKNQNIFDLINFIPFFESLVIETQEFGDLQIFFTMIEKLIDEELDS